MTNRGIYRSVKEKGRESFSKFPAQKGRAAFVIDQVIAAIRDEQFSLGDRLPSERDLAEQMQVGRAAVREALSALQIMGIVERKVGDGTYIVGGTQKPIGIDEALIALQENERLGEIWKARKILEIVLADLAVRKVSEDDLKTIRNCLSRIEVAIAQQDYEDYTTADRDFHLSIAEAAKNPFLKRALQPLLEITHQQLATQVDSAYINQHCHNMIREHSAILEALEKRNVKGISQVVELHFLASEKLFLWNKIPITEKS